MKKGNMIMVAVIAVILAGVVALLLIDRNVTEEKRKDLCMGIGLISEEEAEKCEYWGKYDPDLLTYNGQTVVYDKQNYTVYISQAPENIKNYYDLLGELEWNDPKSTAHFVKNEALVNLEESVRNNVPLTLYLNNGKNCRMVKVIITTLPVISMQGEVSHEDEDGRDVLKGELIFQVGKDPTTGKAVSLSSALEWHLRGQTTANKPKKPWKLSLKDENGENRHLEFMGMGADDDWILNCLTMDDTKIKEKLFMDYWNILAAKEKHMFKMSTGEFVELVVNGAYQGLFLLQRRVDAKYLELPDGDVLLKGVNYGLTKAEDAYEFITDPVNEKQIYATMQKVLDQKDSSMYNLENMIDTNLMLQFASSIDNQGLKNIYHVLVPKNGSYEHYFIPWDTDQSLGVVWNFDTKNFDHNFNESLQARAMRKETNAMMKANPNYEKLEAARWFELREQLLIEEDILAYIDETYASIYDYGAYARDRALWGIRYDGEDTVATMKRFISKRLAYLDAYYEAC
jgi:hypothetical protein